MTSEQLQDLVITAVVTATASTVASVVASSVVSYVIARKSEERQQSAIEAALWERARQSPLFWRPGEP